MVRQQLKQQTFYCMKQLNIILVGTCLTFVFNTVCAQVPGAIQQVDSTEQHRKMTQTAKTFADGASVPELYPDESSDVGSQTVLKIKPRKTLFEASADVQYFYTDNLFLNEKKKRDADVLVSTAQFALAPTPYDIGGGAFAPRIGYQHQWFDFGLAKNTRVDVFDFDANTTERRPVSIFDFNAQTFFVGASWTRDNWTWDVGFDFRRLMSTSSYDEFYKEYVPRWGLQKLFTLNDKMAFTVGYAGDYRFAEANPTIFSPVFPPIVTTIPEDPGDRTDHALFVSYSQTLCPKAVLQPYYQIKYTHFTASNLGRRNDLLNSFGLALYYIVCPNFEVRTFVDYNIRSSDNSAVSEYRQFDGGLGINATFRF
jgi:hypothetical protein